MPSGAAVAAPRPFHETRLYADINRAKCKAAIARSHRKLNSSRPDEYLSKACADPKHPQFQEAQAILTAWRPTFTVVSRPASDPLWQNDSWHLAITVTQGRNKNGQHSEPIQGRKGDLISELASFRRIEDRACEKALRASAVDAIGLDESHDFDIPATPEAKEKFSSLVDSGEAAEKEEKKAVEEAAGEGGQEVERTVVEEDAEFKRQFDALRYLELAARHPHITVQEREQLAEGICRYGLHVAKRTERVLVTAGYAKDAANGFALHALRLMDRGKYQDAGTFRGWLSGVWRNYHWKKHTKEAARQRKSEVGIQRWKGDGEEGRAEAGRVLEESLLDNASAGGLADSLDWRMLELVPMLTPEEKRILKLHLAGETYAHIASLEMVSTRTVQARLKGIQSKASTLFSDDGDQVISIQACADEPQSEPWEAGLIAQMVTKARSRVVYNGCIDLEASADDSRDDSPRLLYDRKGAARQLSISVRSLDYLIAGRKLATRRLGKKVMVPRGELVKFASANHYEPVDAA